MITPAFDMPKLRSNNHSSSLDHVHAISNLTGDWTNLREISQIERDEIKSAQTTIYITVCLICRDHNLERGQWHHQMQLPFFYDIVNTRTTSALLLR